MPLGGSSTYNLEFIASLRGGGQVVSGINQINSSVQKNAAVNQQSAKSIQTVTAETDKSTRSIQNQRTAFQQHSQSVQQHSRDLKALTFGLIGLTSAGVEAAGMLSMYNDVQKSVTEAQAELNEAIKEHGEGSTEATRATQELSKAERFLNMTRRNLILSTFDLLPFLLLTINATTKLRREHQTLAGTEVMLTGVTKNLTRAKAFDAAATTLLARTMTFQLTPALTGAAVAQGGLITATSGFSKVGGILLKVLSPIAVAIGAVVVAMGLYKINAFGFRDVTDDIGKTIGDTLPFLKGFLDRVKNIALAFPNLGKMWAEAMGKGDGGATAVTEELTKAIEAMNQRSKELFNTIAMGDKGERKDIFKILGIKGGAKDEANKLFDRIEKINKAFTSMGQTFELFKRFDLLRQLGLKDGNLEKIVDKQLFTLEDRINEAAEQFSKKGKTRKLLEGLADAFREDAKNPDSLTARAVADYLINTQGIMAVVEASGLPADVVETLGTMVKERAHELAIAATEFNSAQVEAVGDEALGLVTPAGKVTDMGTYKAVFEMTTPQGKSLLERTAGGTGGFDLTGIVFNTLDEVFSPAGWRATAQKYFSSGVVIQGTLMNIQTVFREAISKSGLSGSETGSPFVVGVKIVEAFSIPLLMGLFNAGRWHSSIATFFDTIPIIEGIMTDVFNQFITAVKEYKPPAGSAGFGLNIVIDWLKQFFKGQTASGATGNGILNSTEVENISQDIIGVIQIPSITVTPENIIIAPNTNTTPTFKPQSQNGGDGMSSIGASVYTVSIPSVTLIPETVNFGNLIKSAGLTQEIIKQVFLNLSGELSNIWLGMASNFSGIMNSLGANAKSGGKQIIKHIESALEKVAKTMLALAKHWSKMCNSMINNAKSAAKGITNALNNIPKKIVTVHETRHVDVFGEGGIVRAAGGLMTTNGPKTIMIGDNPGGRETLVAIPHNNPRRWVDMINKMFPAESANFSGSSFSSSGSGGGGDVHIHNHFLDREVLQSYKRENGRLMSRFGSRGSL